MHEIKLKDIQDMFMYKHCIVFLFITLDKIMTVLENPNLADIPGYMRSQRSLSSVPDI